jgi:ceramide glucosyltransferase
VIYLALCLGALILGERLWKHWMVVRFFRTPIPAPGRDPDLISILQPIVSGDPTMPAGLEQNLRFRTRYHLEYLWLVDRDDPAAQEICRALMARYPERAVQLIVLPPPEDRHSPKTTKLIAGARLARGDVVCVLDDDTRLPDEGLEKCLPYLDQPGVGLAFGLPYYVSFTNFWSSLVAFFVNTHSLVTYIPYTYLIEPFTINGMFYVIRRPVLDTVGGFEGLEDMLADDFAVAQRFRAHGYRLAQTPLCHPISTHVNGPRAYLRLLHRWLTFPRETVMKALPWRTLALAYGLAFVPTLLPLLLLVWLLIWPSWWPAAFLVLYLVSSYVMFAHFNAVYLRHAAPWGRSWLVPIIQLLLPIQLALALIAPQRVVWRGHVMRIERGGSFSFVKRRTT